MFVQVPIHRIGGNVRTKGSNMKTNIQQRKTVAVLRSSFQRCLSSQLRLLKTTSTYSRPLEPRMALLLELLL